MNKHHKAILAKLKEAGTSGVYNHELNKITFRYSARIKELRDGSADGTLYQISAERISSGVFKFTLHDQPLTQEALEMVNDILNPQEDKPKLQPGEGMAKWRAIGEKLKASRNQNLENINELRLKILMAQKWLEVNHNHPRFDEALTRYENLEQKYYQLKGE